MTERRQNIAEIAGELTGNKEMKQNVQRGIQRCNLLKTLIQLRVEKGVSQKDIASIVGCDPSTISRLESGDDFDLEWRHIIAYFHAAKISAHICLEEEELPRAERIKSHVFRIEGLLQELAELAGETGDDDLSEKIHLFYGEVLFNFLKRFEDSYDTLKANIHIPDTLPANDPECEQPLQGTTKTREAAEADAS